MEYVNHRKREKSCGGQLFLALEKEMSPIWLYISDAIALSQWQQRPVCGMAWADSRKTPPANLAGIVKKSGEERKKFKSFHYSHLQAKVKKIIQSW